MCIIFGQADYTDRIVKYLRDKSMQLYVFPACDGDPAKAVFDYSKYDDKLRRYPADSEIIVAFNVKNKFAAKAHLQKLGFNNIRLFGSDMDNEMKKDFFKTAFANQGKEFSVIDEKKTVAVYMAKHIADKLITDYPMQLSSHIIPIQVGAALTDKRIANLTDDLGDNISKRNQHFSETTALYWMWKNANADYLGLCHYRRLWKNLDFIAERLQQELIDVVLPFPTLCVHSVYEDHVKRYIPDVYTTMFEVLRDFSPDYYEASKDIYRGDIFYACNMLIAKRKVLHDLCQWMFPLVLEVERRVGDLSDAYYNRYAGFCTEQMITLYFLYNKNKWRITHAEKIFIE